MSKKTKAMLFVLAALVVLVAPQAGAMIQWCEIEMGCLSPAGWAPEYYDDPGCVISTYVLYCTAAASVDQGVEFQAIACSNTYTYEVALCAPNDTECNENANQHLNACLVGVLKDYHTACDPQLEGLLDALDGCGFPEV